MVLTRIERGSIASDVDRSAHGGHVVGTNGLKPKPVSLISHLKVLQSPNEGSVGATASSSHQFVVIDCCDVGGLVDGLPIKLS